MKILLVILVASLLNIFAMAADQKDSASNGNSGGNNNSNNNSNNGGSGVSIGNGGQSVVCRDSEQKILSAEAFDLFEGRALFGYTPIFGNELSAETLAKTLAAKVDLSQGGNREPLKTVAGKVDFIVKNIRFLPSGVGLKPTEDSKEFVLPKECEIVQTVNFRDSLQIFVDSDVWNALPESSKAALFLHEAIYWQFREQGLEQDSRRTRKAVSFLFSGGELAPRAQFFAPPTKPVLYCRTDRKNDRGDYNTKFFAYHHDNLEIFQFLQLGGYGLLGRTILSRTAIDQSRNTPIERQAAEIDFVENWLTSQPDIETFLRLSWGKGSIQLLFRFQADAPREEGIECEEMDFSERTKIWP